MQSFFYQILRLWRDLSKTDDNMSLTRGADGTGVVCTVGDDAKGMAARLGAFRGRFRA